MAAAARRETPVARRGARAWTRPAGAAVVLLLAGACASNTRIHTGPAVWRDARILVVPFGPPTRVVSYDDPGGELGGQLAARVVDELRRRGYTAEVASNDPAAGSAVTVRGRVLEVNGGSHAKRFWLGFGAGRSSLSAEGTVTRDDGTVLGAFRERRSSSGEAQLGFARDQTLVRNCLNALASDIADMIVTGKYREAALHDRA